MGLLRPMSERLTWACPARCQGGSLAPPDVREAHLPRPMSERLTWAGQAHAPTARRNTLPCMDDELSNIPRFVECALAAFQVGNGDSARQLLEMWRCQVILVAASVGILLVEKKSTRLIGRAMHDVL